MVIAKPLLMVFNDLIAGVFKGFLINILEGRGGNGGHKTVFYSLVKSSS